MGAGLVLAGCGGGPTTPATSVASVTVIPPVATLAAGITVQLIATTKDAAGNVLTGHLVTWASSNTAAATVSGSGLVTGVATGSATITATSEGKSGTATVTLGFGFLTVSTGNGMACGITLLNTAYCWGSSYAGQLGATTTEVCPFGPCSSTPIAVSGGLTFGMVTDGTDNACGLTPSGAAYCWGDNTFGELGNGTTTQSTAPVPVAGNLTFVTLSASDNESTCGVTTSGTAYCWGKNGSGELGAATTQICDSMACSTTPIAVAGGLAFVTISAAQQYTCGVTSGGDAYCWGDNSFGQLGNGTMAPSTMPVPVRGGLSFAAVSAGYSNACGVTTSGAAYCWGDNSVGQLGTGTTTGSATPVAVAGGMTFTAVTTGFGNIHTCGVTPSGAAYCWGDNTYGALGNGTTTPSHTPVAVSGGLTFRVVSTGPYHTSGVTTGNIAYTWGSNGYGQLGIGTSGNNNASAVPVKVAGQP